MKKIIVLTVSLIALQIAFNAGSLSAAIINPIKTQTTSLSDFTGKYQMVQKRGTVAIRLDNVNGELVCTQLWDGEKLLLRHLKDDNFIMAGLGWSVKFLRDKDKKVTQVLVMGTDRWDKVKE